MFSTRWSKVKSIAISIGRTSVDGEGILRAVDWRVASGYGWRNFARDFAVVKLEQPVSTGLPFELATVVSAEDVAAQVNIAGYPGGSGGDRNGKNLFAGTGSASYTPGSDMLDYDIDTETGNSGGPIWVHGAGDVPQIVGVHVTELGGTHGRARIANAGLVSEVECMISQMG